MSDALKMVLGGGDGTTLFTTFFRDNALAMLNMVLPYAWGIFGAFFLWVIVLHFFTKLCDIILSSPALTGHQRGSSSVGDVSGSDDWEAREGEDL